MNKNLWHFQEVILPQASQRTPQPDIIEVDPAYAASDGV